MVYVKTSDEKDKILRNDQKKLKDEVDAKKKELHLDKMIPRNGQNAYQQLEDMKNEQSHIQEIMAVSKEKTEREKKAKKEANKKSMSQQLKMYLSMQERQSKQDYEKRRIFFRDGGFDKYESQIRMMPFKVLLKQIKKVSNNNGIIVPETCFEKYPHYVVIAVGSDCDYVRDGMNVMVESYAGTEIVSGNDIYRIVTYTDIFCEVEE